MQMEIDMYVHKYKYEKYISISMCKCTYVYIYIYLSISWIPEARSYVGRKTAFRHDTGNGFQGALIWLQGLLPRAHESLSVQRCLTGWFFLRQCDINGPQSPQHP